jgi:ABC-type multidrug transport system ATPase subunit
MSQVWQLRALDAGFNAQEGRLKSLSFEVLSGERVAIMCEDSAKSRALLLRVLAGLRPHKQGELKILGEEISLQPYWADWDRAIPNRIRRRLGVCLEEEGLLSNVSIREGLELLFRFKYGDHTEKLSHASSKIVSSTCERFGLESVMGFRPNALSREERRLAGLARAFLSKPHVLVLENPTWGVSDLNYERVYSAIEYLLTARERTLMLATDDWVLVRAFCQRVLVLKDGELFFDGSPQEYLNSHPAFLERLREIQKLKSSWLREEGVA